MSVTSNASLVIGRGSLYFSKFLPGTTVGEGELYLGNTPGFSVMRDVVQTDRYTSFGGQKMLRDSVITQEKLAASLTTDNVSVENLALWFAGEIDETGQFAAGEIDENVTIKRGRWFQLGLSISPVGVRHVHTQIKFFDGLVEIPVENNFILELEDGRFFVSKDAANVLDGQNVRVRFEWRRSRSSIITPSPMEILGSLRFIASNPVGEDTSYFFPHVSLSATGEIDLKADAWQRFSWKVDVRKLTPNSQFVYIVREAISGNTVDEDSIIEFSGIDLNDFAGWEDQLDVVVNTDMPADFG